MQPYRATLNSLNSGIHLPTAVSHLATSLIRNSRDAYFRWVSMPDWKPVCIATAIMLVTSGLCLSLTPPEKLIIPGSFLGGIHPASMEMILKPASR